MLGTFISGICYVATRLSGFLLSILESLFSLRYCLEGVLYMSPLDGSKFLLSLF